MIQEVKEIKIETRTYWRLVLACGHIYTRLIPNKEQIKKRYICHACKHQKEREARGARPNLKQRKNHAK